ncbi:MAG: O-antigen ligase family protein [Myxococcota bacterium]|nr:O-antigen ligase family protein [Myxococcota bacterium]
MLRDFLAQRIPQTPGGLRSLEVGIGAIGVAVLAGLILFTDPRLVLGAVVAIAAGLYFFSQPAKSLVAIFVIRVVIDLFWWAPVNVGGLNVLELFGGAVAAGGAVLFYVELRKVERTPGFVLLLIYLLILVVAAARSGEVRDAAEIMAKYVSPLILMFLIGTLIRGQDLRRAFFMAVTGACLISLAVSTYHLATGQIYEHFRQGYYRLIGGYANLHNHALFLLFTNSLLLFWTMKARTTLERVLAGALLLTGLTCQYYTFVRTALTGFALFSTLFLAMEKRWRILAVAGLVAGAAFASSDAMLDRFSDVVQLFGEGDAMGSKRTLGSGRFGIWTSSFSEFMRQDPADIVLGLGLGGHYEMTDGYADMYRSLEKSENLDSHNDYLSLLYQLGPIALLAYVGLQITVVRRALRLMREGSPFERSFARYIIALTAATIVADFLSNAFIQRVTVAWLYWAMVGVMYGMIRDRDEDPQALPAGVVPLSARPAG